MAPIGTREIGSLTATSYSMRSRMHIFSQAQWRRPSRTRYSPTLTSWSLTQLCQPAKSRRLLTGCTLWRVKQRFMYPLYARIRSKAISCRLAASVSKRSSWLRIGKLLLLFSSQVMSSKSKKLPRNSLRQIQNSKPWVTLRYPKVLSWNSCSFKRSSIGSGPIDASSYCHTSAMQLSNPSSSKIAESRTSESKL